MKNYYFRFSKEQQKGVFLLFLIIAGIQFIYFFVDFKVDSIVDLEEQKWLSLETEIHSIQKDREEQAGRLYLFNPNFISDYKGYRLGMSVAEVDKLLAFRKENKYVNSVEEFQYVTGVSDSLLAVISPYFKFPDWVKDKEVYKYAASSNAKLSNFSKKEKLVIKDINQATQEDLMKVNGIGEGFSVRILKYKESLGGFVSMEQMKEIWGLSPEVAQRLGTCFKVGALSDLKKIDINNASVKELAQFPYFKYNLAREIVIYRSMNGGIKNTADLIKIKGFPVDKENIIGLYLDF